jgi:hypothetical protein
VRDCASFHRCDWLRVEGLSKTETILKSIHWQSQIFLKPVVGAEERRLVRVDVHDTGRKGL